MGPALDEDGQVRVSPSTSTRSPEGTASLAGFSTQPSCWLSRSSITRSASRCSRELPGGSSRPAWMAPASINTAVRETPASEAAGPLSGCRPRSSSHSLMIFLSGPGRRRTSPARASSRQIWLTLCRGEMPVWSASWSSSRGRELIRIASMMRSRWLPGCMTASMLPRGRGCAIRRNRPGSPRLKDHSRKTLTTRDMQSATCAMAAGPERRIRTLGCGQA